MHGIRRPDVEGLLAASGATVVAEDSDEAAGAWESWTYLVTKAR